MSKNQNIQHDVTNISLKPKKINRTNKTPIYADELAEVKINSHTTRLTFGFIYPETDNPEATHTLVNESVTIAMPTANFLAAISQMIAPIVENEQLLNVLHEDYSNMADYAKNQLKNIKPSKK